MFRFLVAQMPFNCLLNLFGNSRRACSRASTKLNAFPWFCFAWPIQQSLVAVRERLFALCLFESEYGNNYCDYYYLLLLLLLVKFELKLIVCTCFRLSSVKTHIESACVNLLCQCSKPRNVTYNSKFCSFTEK